MELTNRSMDLCVNVLQRHLNHKGKLGYAAARNLRKMQESLTEYNQRKEELIKKYGEKETDDEGKETGVYRIPPNTEEIKKYLEEIREIADIKHDVEVFELNPEDVMDELTGSEILELGFMIKGF